MCKDGAEPVEYLYHDAFNMEDQMHFRSKAIRLSSNSEVRFAGKSTHNACISLVCEQLNCTGTSFILCWWNCCVSEESN